MQEFIIDPTKLRGEWRFDEPLAQYTSWRVGGKAQYYYRPADLADLAVFLQLLPIEVPLFCFGLGSNVLFRDGGIRGVVVHFHKCFDQINFLQTTIRIESGVTCAKIARFCAKHNMLGGEFFAGIPGTMGGALAMNAGAFGAETWNYVRAVEIINRQGLVTILPADQFAVSYRSISLKSKQLIPGHISSVPSNMIESQAQSEAYFPCAGYNEAITSFYWFVAGHMQFAIGDGELAQQKVKGLLKQRNLTQPIGQLSCGSVFKNPAGNYAAKLIEASGLKGMRLGDAQISSKHANFIINIGNARAVDIEALIQLVQEKVLAEHGIKLEREVKIIGEG